MIALEHIKNVLITWAIMPASERASQRIGELAQQYSNLQWVTRILELGPGTGNLTHRLMKQDNVHITCFEVLESFVGHLRSHYHDYDNIEIHHDGAENMMNYLEPWALDVVVSTIPMTFLWDDFIPVLQHIHAVLKPWWVFISGQIRSQQNKFYAEHIWEEIYLDRVWGLQPILVSAYLKNASK